jgi:vacuolar protein sorting-associated protein 54
MRQSRWMPLVRDGAVPSMDFMASRSIMEPYWRLNRCIVAISTVLNHPTKRAAPPKAHSTLPTVPPADLPRVRRKDFDPYLKDIGPQWNTFQRALAQSTRERSNSTTTIEVDPDGLQASPISPSISMASAGMARTRPMPSLDTVPPTFFDPDFNLTNPATFALVTEMNLTSNDPRGLLLEQDPASISYSVPLLERLSHYADTVEGHLVQEIQARSSSFFSALTNLHDLQSESERCLRRIADLKSMLMQIDEKGAKNGLELVREDMKITHLRKLEDGVKLVKDVNEMRTIAKGLAGAGEWSDALNVVENVQALMDYKPPDSSPAGQRLSTVGEEEANSFETSPVLPPVDTTKLPTALQDVSLRSLHALGSLPTELRTLSSQIASMLADEFAAVNRQDLSFRTDNTLLPETAKLEDEQMLKERLSPLVMGLMRTGDGGVKDGLERWREVVMGEVRSAVMRVRNSHLLFTNLRNSNSMSNI